MTTLPGYDHPVAQRHTESLAARSVDVESDLDRRYLRSTTLWGRSNAAKTWKWFERIGEIRFGTGRSARIAGFATFFVEYFNDDGVWEKVGADHPAFPEGRRVRSPNGGSRGLVERFYTLMKVPGDAYLIADEDDKDGYHFIGAEEIDPGGAVSASDAFEKGVTWITAWEMGSDDVLRQGISPGNFLGRVWSPSKRFFAQVDSPLLAMQTECEVLYLLTQLMKSRLKSRFALNGIFYIPDSINEVNVATIDGEPKREKILSYLARAMTLNVQHFDKPEASVPIFLRGPGEAGEQIKLIRQDESIAETDLKLRGELIERILDGLDVQKKATGGQNDSTNHWERWSISDEERRTTVQPDIEMLCSAWDQLVLHPRLRRRHSGVKNSEVHRYRMWFSLTAASIKSNQAEDGRQLADRLAIGEKALREIHNVPDSMKPTPEERIRGVGLKMSLPRLALYGVEGVDDIPDSWLIPSKAPGPNSDSPADPTPAGPGKGQPGSPDDKDSDGPKRSKPA